MLHYTFVLDTDFPNRDFFLELPRSIILDVFLNGKELSIIKQWDMFLDQDKVVLELFLPLKKGDTLTLSYVEHKYSHEFTK